MASIFSTATEYRRLAVTIASGGDVQDISAVGVAFTEDPNNVPDPGGEGLGDFTEVTLDTSGATPDILVLIGPREGSDINPGVGTYQCFTILVTADEHIIDAPDTLEVLGSA